jgi:hypothetical protein
LPSRRNVCGMSVNSLIFSDMVMVGAVSEGVGGAMCGGGVRGVWTWSKQGVLYPGPHPLVLLRAETRDASARNSACSGQVCFCSVYAMKIRDL